jgi:hypothetical protein
MIATGREADLLSYDRQFLCAAPSLDTIARQRAGGFATHAAGNVARQFVDSLGIDLDPPQPFRRGGTDIAVMPRADRHQALADGPGIPR